jgi:hypothetical protein
MSDGLSGFGGGPVPFLPRGVLAAWRQEERAEAQQRRQAEAAQAERAEHRRSADLAAYRDSCVARGEYVDPIAFASGSVNGRPVAQILAEASARADYE